MSNSDKRKFQHGGKRPNSGRKKKYPYMFKLEVGQACENLYRSIEAEVALNANKHRVRYYSELEIYWHNAHLIPIHQRREWLRSKHGMQHTIDVEIERDSLNYTFSEMSKKMRKVAFPPRVPYGTRKKIILKVQERYKKYCLKYKDVDNMWVSYRQFERSLKA